MSKLQTIDPFELLGVDEKSTIKEARKAYYNLALLVHPDCGGNEESMKVLANAYNFVEKQLKNKNDITGNWEDLGKNLEESFEKFNLEVKAEIPKLTDLYDLADMQQKAEAKKRNFGVYNNKFNDQFEEECKYQFEEVVASNPFEKGYGDLMDEDHDYDTDEEYVMPTKNKFTQEMQVYKEPHILPDTYGSNFRYDVDKIKDFSDYNNNNYDYKMAHSEMKNPAKEFKADMDVPMNELENLVKRREEERNKLAVYRGKIKLGLSKDELSNLVKRKEKDRNRLKFGIPEGKQERD